MGLAVLALAGWLIGCGGDRSPVAQEEPRLDQATEAPGHIVLGSARLAKITGRRWRDRQTQEASGSAQNAGGAAPEMSKSTSGMFYPDQWNSLEITDWRWSAADTDGSIIVKRVWFAVEWGAVREPVAISMTATWKRAIEDVAVAFTPPGQVFNTPSTLQIHLHGPLKDEMFADGVYHIDAQGNVTRIGIVEIDKQRTDGNNSEWVITIKIPGFSRYSMSGRGA